MFALAMKGSMQVHGVLIDNMEHEMIRFTDDGAKTNHVLKYQVCN